MWLFGLGGWGGVNVWRLGGATPNTSHTFLQAFEQYLHASVLASCAAAAVRAGPLPSKLNGVIQVRWRRGARGEVSTGGWTRGGSTIGVEKGSGTSSSFIVQQKVGIQARSPPLHFPPFHSP